MQMGDYTAGDLWREVQEKHAELRDRNPDAGIPKSWILNGVMAQHSDAFTFTYDDGRKEVVPVDPFYVVAAYEGVSRTVDKYLQGLRRKEEDPEVPSPDLFPEADFRRLQKEYNIVREEERQEVPLASMTEAEVNAKIAELRLGRDGLDRHISELERYRDMRWPKRKAS